MSKIVKKGVRDSHRQSSIHAKVCVESIERKRNEKKGRLNISGGLHTKKKNSKEMNSKNKKEEGWRNVEKHKGMGREGKINGIERSPRIESSSHFKGHLEKRVRC